MREITAAEQMLMDSYFPGAEIVEVNEQEFDIRLEGKRIEDRGPDNFVVVHSETYTDGKMVKNAPVTINMGGVHEYKYSAWLPLGVIRERINSNEEACIIAFEMSDYPTMAGDWSAIRDSSPETIWDIFRALTEGGPIQTSSTPGEVCLVTIPGFENVEPTRTSRRRRPR